MATVEKDIKEESDKIKAVKKIVKKRVKALQNKELVQTPLSDGPSWKDLQFSHLENTVRIGTLFSGIGAIEHAFQRLKLKHKIIFAGDIEPRCKTSYFANYDIREDDWFLRYFKKRTGCTRSRNLYSIEQTSKRTSKNIC